MTMCGSCYGKGEVTCPSCSGKGYIGRLTGNAEFEMNPCAVCAGRKRIKCGACQGRGQLGSPQPSPILPGPRAARKKSSDVLAGHWITTGGSYDFIKEKNGYRVIETGALGKTGQGKAVLEGNEVTLTIRNIFGNFTYDLTLDGDTLEGELTVMGMTMPMILSRE
jgi:hypothetical protein